MYSTQDFAHSWVLEQKYSLIEQRYSVVGVEEVSGSVRVKERIREEPEMAERKCEIGKMSLKIMK